MKYGFVVFGVLFAVATVCGAIASDAYYAGVMPEDYPDKESFLKDYYIQERDRLTAAQRIEDRKTLGGEALRKRTIRRAGERLWNRAQEMKKDRAKAGCPIQPEGEDIKKFLAGKPLTSLFGIELGSTPDLSTYKRLGESCTYMFAPPKKFRGYKRYVFSVTPITHQIYGIRASDLEFKSSVEDGTGAVVKSEWEATKAAFEKKFEKIAKVEIGDEVHPNFKLLFPDASGGVGREISVVFGASITAVDVKLKKLAEEEAQVERRKLVESAAENDAEAL